MSLAEESIRLMEYFGWTSCGAEYWEHGDYLMQQFHESEAILLAREMSRKNLLMHAERRAETRG